MKEGVINIPTKLVKIDSEQKFCVDNMSHFAYFVTFFIICAVLVPTGKAYRYFPEAKGWVARHPILATWDEALQECRAEGAVLMSPTTVGHLRVMQSLINGNTTYYVGTSSLLHPRQLVSVEGIALSYMALSDVLEPVAASVDLCVVMDSKRAYTSSCLQRLPFFCYRQETTKQVMTECGTFDQGYKLNNITGSCYKFHNTLKTWINGYSTCANEGGYLSVINDDVEARELAKVITNRNYYTSVGLLDWQGGGNWMSIHKDRMENIFHSWIGNRQPSSPCCKIGTFDILSGTIREWGDTMIIPYICEKDPKNIIFPRS